MIMAGGSLPSSRRRIAMCEFCTQHGEGKQWYLQMKNYSNELLHTPLTPQEKEIVGYTTRREWMDGFVKSSVIPASIGQEPEEIQPVGETQDIPATPPSVEQILLHRKIEHFGQ